MAPNRGRGRGVADIAGTIDSSSGRAMATPAPRSSVRRESALRVMKAAIVYSREATRVAGALPGRCRKASLCTTASISAARL